MVPSDRILDTYPKQDMREIALIKAAIGQISRYWAYAEAMQ